MELSTGKAAASGGDKATRVCTQRTRACLATRDDSCVAPFDLLATTLDRCSNRPNGAHFICSYGPGKFTLPPFPRQKQIQFTRLVASDLGASCLVMVIYENLPYHLDMNSQAIYVCSKEVRSRKRFGVCAQPGNRFDLVSYRVVQFDCLFPYRVCQLTPFL